MAVETPCSPARISGKLRAGPRYLSHGHSAQFGGVLLSLTAFLQRVASGKTADPAKGEPVAHPLRSTCGVFDRNAATVFGRGTVEHHA